MAKMSKIKKLTKREKMELRAKIEDEGLDYYLRQYSRDYSDFERAGINLEDLQKAVDIYDKIEVLLNTFPEYEE